MTALPEEQWLAKAMQLADEYRYYPNVGNQADLLAHLRSRPAVVQEPVARLELMTDVDTPIPLYQVVVLQRSKCFDGMPLYAAPSPAEKETQ